MKVVLLLLLALPGQTALRAQNKTFVEIKAGSQVTDVLTTADILLYPQFTDGSVFFRDGTTVGSKLNYNCLFDEIHFIDPRGDTLALANEKTINFISIDKDTFYYMQGYLRLLAGNHVARLAEKQRWRVEGNKLGGAFNTTGTSSAITSYTSYNTRGSRYGLVVNENMELRKVRNYYFGDTNNRFVPAGKKNLLALFPKAQRQIERFVAENKIDFTKREDLEQVIQFLQHL